MEQSPSLRTKYNAFMNKYENMGQMTKINNDNKTNLNKMKLIIDLLYTSCGI